jgi:hypothetical protein
MKKSIFLLAALFLASISFVSAQDKKETKDKNKNYNYNYNNWSGDWGGKRIEGEGRVVTSTIDVKDFTGVKSMISADIALKQSSSFKITVEGQKNITDLINFNVVEGTLKIGFERGYSINYREKLKISIEAPRFEYLGMSGSGDVSQSGEFSGDKLQISISGSGNFDLPNLRYTDMRINISGSGDMVIGGSAESIDLGISGSGDLNASNLKATKAKCRISGSGDMTLNVSKELDAQISGSGDIRYSGNPSSVRTRVSGSGDIESK